LRVAGLQFDRIKILGHVYKQPNNLTMEQDFAYTARWLAEAEALATAQVIETYYDEESRLEAFIRTIVGNTLTDGSNEPPETEQCFGDYEAVKQFFTAISTLLGPGIPNYSLLEGFVQQPFAMMEKVSKFLHYFKCATDGRRLCVTEHGRMAIMPPLSLPGDVICIFNGARTPFVLREKSLGYSLVGCCYVHGVMSGEIDIKESQPFVLV
jgi:hypothetical protein